MTGKCGAILDMEPEPVVLDGVGSVLSGILEMSYEVNFNRRFIS